MRTGSFIVEETLYGTGRTVFIIICTLASRTVRSTTDTSGVGTLKAIPVNLPFSSGMTLPTALAAPVEAGMMFWAAPRPSLQALPEGPSTVFWAEDRVGIMNTIILIKKYSNLQAENTHCRGKYHGTAGLQFVWLRFSSCTTHNQFFCLVKSNYVKL